jgi:ferric-dicitrate binding protein FerR (iron transport regulator)
MRNSLAHEQKSLFESLSQKDEAALHNLEQIWDESASYEPKITFNKEAAYSKFMKDIQKEAAPASNSGGIGTVIIRSAIAIAIAATLFFAYNALFSYKTIKTTDNIEFATLEDGTEIWLNKHSELRYPRSFASDARKVTLKGEAFFDVAHDEKASFSVELSNKNLVTVLGTSFNINDKYKSKVEVSVSEGKVNLQNTEKENLSIDISVGQRGILNVSKEEISSENLDDNFLAWRETEMSFTNESLTSVLESTGIFYGVQFRLAPSATLDCPLTTVINRETNVSDAISGIEKAFSGLIITKTSNTLYDVQGTCK